MSAPIGEVRVDVRGDTSKVEPDIEKGLKRASADLDDDLNKLGKDFGNTISSSMEKEFHKHGPAFSKSIENAVEKNIPLIPWDLNTDRDVVRRSVTHLADDIKDEVKRLGSSSGGGPFGFIGKAIADAIGAGFNISGKSPLILFLIPLFGAIAELVVGAIQAINALSAALLTVPSLIGAIILQVGVLFLAFKGLGGAIQGAFAAMNEGELKKALEGVTPAAAAFVRTLLPLKDIFKTWRDIAQEAFFQQLGNSILVITKAIGPLLQFSIGPIAASLGQVARTLLTFLGDPVFVRFLSELIPATIRWIDSFNAALFDFLQGVANLGHAVMPFFEWLGSSLNRSLSAVGKWFSDLSVDPDFTNWLKDMEHTFGQLGKVIDSTALFIFNLVKAVHEAGGDETLEDIATQLGAIAAFLGTDEGVKSIEGLIHVIYFLSQSFTLLIVTILFVSAALESFFEFLADDVWPWIQKVFGGIGDFFGGLGEGILHFFLDLGTGWTAVKDNVSGAFTNLGTTIMDTLTSVRDALVARAQEWIGAIVNFAQSIPGKVTEAVGNLKDLLFQAGRNLIDGLIAGIKSMFGPLGDAASRAAQIFKSHWPLSPAKEGPLAGAGDPIYAGQELVKRLSAGIAMEAPALAAASSYAANSVVFGPNSIQVGFNGALPTQQQALTTGTAVGQGVSQVLAARDTRLAVRTL